MNIFKFDQFLIPKIIKFFYRVGVILAFAVGLFQIFTGISKAIEYSSFQSQITTLLMGLGIGIFVPLILRVLTELTLLLFKIEENTRKKRS